MGSLSIEKLTVVEGRSAALLGRFSKLDGTYPVQAGVMSVVLKVFDDTGALTASVPYFPDDVIFNTLQTDSKWTRDPTGYNLLLRVIPSQFTKGAGVYGCEVEAVMFDDSVDDNLGPEMETLLYAVSVVSRRGG